MTPDGDSTILHASTVAIGGKAVLITGPSGSGKSTLALDLISRGLQLVADDRTVLHRRSDCLIASAPPSLVGLIEARGIGILPSPYHGPAIVRLVVDLGTPTQQRLPDRQSITILGIGIDLIYGGETPNLAPAIHLYLQAARVD